MLDPERRLPVGGTVHTSRTLMLADLTRLLEAVPAGSPTAAYRAAVQDENALMKPTAGTRERSWTYLRRLYALDAAFPPWGAFRRLWDEDPAARPLLALLTAVARDPLLAATAEWVAGLALGTGVKPAELEAQVRAHYGGHLTAKTLASTGQNLASTWAQAGHLSGILHKRRSRALATPGSVAYAMLLGQLEGRAGLRLFSSRWIGLLDADEAELDALAYAASKRGWLTYRRIGDVAEFDLAPLMPRPPEGGPHVVAG